MYEAFFKKQTFYFKVPAGTSRGILTEKDSWFIFLKYKNLAETGVGECSIIYGLSRDEMQGFEKKIIEVCDRIDELDWWIESGLTEYPSIRFGLETAKLDLESGGRHVLFASDFTSGSEGIQINGLVWMGTFEEMRNQIVRKIDAGFSCIKLKIGSLHFEDELNLIRMIRAEFNEKDIQLRLDANGALKTGEALEKLKRLADYCIHSIEQPIKVGQWPVMNELCKFSPIPIALDEELIAVKNFVDFQQLIQTIEPSYIVLKPSLLGGLKVCDQLIAEAEFNGVGWWATSALESNIGLNAVAQWVFLKNCPIAQGLGTGQLFSNNIESPLVIESDRLFYKNEKKWGSVL